MCKGQTDTKPQNVSSHCKSKNRYRMKNYYQILGIERTSNSIDIKSAYRKLALKFHPDKNNGDKFFEDRFKEIQEAYETLSDEKKKYLYDIEYDLFFNIKSRKSDNNRNEYDDFKNENLKKEQKERDYKENLEKERIKNIKKNTELPFEDKAWIFIGNWFIIPGLVGLIMFFKYQSQGYTKKSKSVCSLTLISFITFIFLAIILTIGNALGN